jgi:hypothetical protein
LHIIDIIPDHFLYSSLCQNGHRRAPLCCEWLNATCIINVCRIPMIPLKYQLSRQHVSIYSKIFWLKCPFGQLSTQQNRWMFELFQLLCKNSTGSRTENCWEHLGADWELMVKWPRWCQERYPKWTMRKKSSPNHIFISPSFFGPQFMNRSNMIQYDPILNQSCWKKDSKGWEHETKTKCLHWSVWWHFWVWPKMGHPQIQRLLAHVYIMFTSCLPTKNCWFMVIIVICQISAQSPSKFSPRNWKV